VRPIPIRFTQAARRHKIGKAHVLHVMNNFDPIEMADRRYWLDEDETGRLLEIIAVVDTAKAIVIHVMPYALREGGKP